MVDSLHMAEKFCILESYSEAFLLVEIQRCCMCFSQLFSMQNKMVQNFGDFGCWKTSNVDREKTTLFICRHGPCSSGTRCYIGFLGS